jgi:hypothetical protein
MEPQVNIEDVLASLREQIGVQAQQIAILQAQLKTPSANS